MQVATRYVVVTCHASSDVSCGRRLRRRVSSDQSCWEAVAKLMPQIIIALCAKN